MSDQSPEDANGDDKTEKDNSKILEKYIKVLLDDVIKRDRARFNDYETSEKSILEKIKKIEGKISTIETEPSFRSRVEYLNEMTHKNQLSIRSNYETIIKTRDSIKEDRPFFEHARAIPYLVQTVLVIFSCLLVVIFLILNSIIRIDNNALNWIIILGMIVAILSNIFFVYFLKKKRESLSILLDEGNRKFLEKLFNGNNREFLEELFKEENRKFLKLLFKEDNPAFLKRLLNNSNRKLLEVLFNEENQKLLNVLFDEGNPESLKSLLNKEKKQENND